MKNKYRKISNWLEIILTTQKPGDADHFYARLKEVSDHNSHSDMTNNSPYEQQLKNALLRGPTPKLRGFVTKHMVNYRPARLSDFIEHCKHAEEHLTKDQKLTKNICVGR